VIRFGSQAFFSARPRLSVVVAVAFLALGAAFLGGWHPRAGAGEIARGETILMTGVCVVIAAYFLHCARLGKWGHSE
jgi:hypothetical protein